MNSPGPSLEALTHRLADTPAEFMEPPRHVDAVVNDLLKLHGARAGLAALRDFAEPQTRTDRNRLALVMIAAWLLADEWFIHEQLDQAALLHVLAAAVPELAQATSAHKFVADSERREELARVALARLGYRPAGETLEQATDRLSGISGTERRHLLEASRAAEQRAREIREALARQAAEESADKWSRE